MLEFWEKEKIFEKSVTQRRQKGAKKYVFFDGPPFANGLPHYGHLLANTLKDTVTRYWTMKGYYVPRVNGWDCHGLPVEYEIEKELKISGKKDIEKMGVARFNTECRKSVFRYTEEWEKTLKRLGRWVDFEHSYATLENSYMESIWWVFKKIWEKNMVYQGHKSMHICPRCETPLSNFEVTLGYKDVTDPSVTVKFQKADEKNAYFLAWTTTPWTLPGNTALAVHPEITYAKVKAEEHGQAVFYWLAENRIPFYFKDRPHTIVEKVRGKILQGMIYAPLFDFYKDKLSKKAFYLIEEDYVSTEEGTGIVHTAPAFGEADYLSSVKYDLPVIQHVNFDGTFKSDITKWAGKFVKSQDLTIVDALKKEGKVFHYENYRHSYPHCWRCDTPLLNYTTKSWFIRVTDLKEKLIENNRKINWVPSHIRDGRFGKWLENVRDWNISRNRYWGCPIPIWECEKCGFQKCIGSIKELRENSAGGNTYIFVRHGEAENNVKKILNSDPKHVFHLTATGRKQAEETAKTLAKEKIDMIFASPFPRAKETAEIIGIKLGLDVTFDQHLREHFVGPYEGKTEKEFAAEFPTLELRLKKKAGDAESFQEVETRVANFLDYLGRKYAGKTILIVSHGNVIRGALHAFGEKNLEETFASISPFGGITKIYVGKLPKREGKLDLHKPYIDEITFRCEKCGSVMKRIEEVLDCWFESGAMPYAQLHYPFERKEEFEANFPAHFIAEGLDQTRGWFYTLHVLATILFDKPAFWNVIVNGVILAEDGEKLSKRKKNYPDPKKLFAKLGVDSMRLYLCASNAAIAEDVRFSEKLVEEIVKKFTLTLWNTYSFFVTYANIDKFTPEASLHGAPKNQLDQWILSELHTLVKEVTEKMDAYNLTEATRPLITFVENLSNWYVRRSRRRFWKSENDKDKYEAYGTLHAVLVTLAKLLAPFMPFTADAIFKNLTGNLSVHLEDWPTSDPRAIDEKLNREIALTRVIVRLGHSLRQKKNIKVRQPLHLLQIALPPKIAQRDIEAYRDVILEELNVKEIAFLSDASKIAKSVFRPNPRVLGPKYGAEVQKILKLSKEGKFEILDNGMIKVENFTLLEEEGEVGYEGKEGFDVTGEDGVVVALDTNLTPALVEEGYVREIVRHLQEMRKEAGYNVADRIYVFIHGEKPIPEIVTRFADYIERETLATEIQESGDFEWDKEREIDLEGLKVKLGVRK